MNESDREFTRAAWETLNATPRFQVRYPHERVVSWTLRHFPRQNASSFRLLDLGAGAGRHSLFWLREGYRVAATDIARSGIEVTQALVAEEGFKIEAQVGSADAIDFEDQSFDGVMCFGVLYYLDKAAFERAFFEIHRVLKPGGKALIVTRDTADERCKRATPLANDMYRLGALGEGAASEAEAGMVMTFVDRTEIERLTARFTERSLEWMHFSEGNGCFINADWYIQLTR